MSTYANVTADALIFTDLDQVSGGITVGDGHVTLLTQGSTILLRRLLFGPDGDPPSVEEIIGDLFPGLSKAELDDTATHVFDVLSYLRKSQSPPTLGPVDEAVLKEASTLSVGGHPTTYCPAGTLFKREVGKHTVHFSVGSISLAAAVRPNPSLASVAASGTKIEVRTPAAEGPGHDYLYPDGGPVPVPHPHPAPHPKPHPGPHCGVCGSCGLCGLCGEINYAAAAAAAVAVTSMGLVAAELQTGRRQLLGPDRPTLDPSEITSAVTPLLKVANELTEKS